MLKNSTILVTGGAGAIGRHLVHELASHNQIIVLDNLASGYLDNIFELKNIDFINASILDDEVLRCLFSRYAIDYVFHLAANFANQNSVLFPRRDLEINSLGTLKLLQYSQDATVKRFVYTSSSCVYGNKSLQNDESTLEFEPETPYAISKLSGEMYVNFFNHYWKLPTVVVRVFNAYGPGEYPGPFRNVITNFFWAALNQAPLHITGSGDETRDFTFVGDVVKGLLSCATNEKAPGQVFNIGTGKETAIKEIAAKIKALTGSKSTLSYVQTRSWDTISRRKANIEKARTILGYEPVVDIDTGLKATLAWFEKQRGKSFNNNRVFF
ncbi:MAG: NAD-dependent epimerase/dehydratase family protein [Syntrophomonadaceae bacterium]